MIAQPDRAGLPDAKLPTRQDFTRADGADVPLTNGKRLSGKQLGERFLELCKTGDIAALIHHYSLRIMPFEGAAISVHGRALCPDGV